MIPMSAGRGRRWIGTDDGICKRIYRLDKERRGETRDAEKRRDTRTNEPLADYESGEVSQRLEGRPLFCTIVTVAVKVIVNIITAAMINTMSSAPAAAVEWRRRGVMTLALAWSAVSTKNTRETQKRDGSPLVVPYSALLPVVSLDQGLRHVFSRVDSVEAQPLRFKHYLVHVFLCGGEPSTCEWMGFI